MKRRKRQKKSNKSMPLIIIASIFLVLVFVGILFFNNKEDKISLNKPNVTKKTKPVEKKLNIINPESDTRNVAVMINNIKTVWGYQSGIQDAYIVYEIIAEGGITRLMGIFKDTDTERIGTVRSARIYYLDYVLENDAIYVHIGGSKEAKRDIKSLNIADFNSEVTFRDRSIGLNFEHTAFTSMDRIMKKVESRKVRKTTKQDALLNYSIDPIDLSKMNDSMVANNIEISFSANKRTSFTYDEKNKVYKRFQNEREHTDYVTKKQYTVKNIITYQVRNSSYDSYGRQTLDNVGTGTGYFITNGYAVPITWEKKSRASQTVYRYQDGTEIKVNDGNTHIEIQPKNRKLTIN